MLGIVALVASMLLCAVATPANAAADGDVVRRDAPSPLVEVNEHTFEATLGAVPLAVVFYSRGTAECRELEAELADAATELATLNPPVVVAKVDVRRSNALQLRHGVGHLPGLKVFRHANEVHRPWGGGHAAAGIVDYVRRRLLTPPSVLVGDLAEAEAYVPHPGRTDGVDGVVVFAYYKRLDDFDVLQLFAAAEDLAELPDSVAVTFVHTTSTAVMAEHGFRHTFAVYNPERAPRPVGWDAQKPVARHTALEFLQQHARPWVGVLTPAAAPLLKRPDGAALHCFFADPADDADAAARRAAALVAALTPVARAHPATTFLVAGARAYADLLKAADFMLADVRAGNASVVFVGNTQRKFRLPPGHDATRRPKQQPTGVQSDDAGNVPSSGDTPSSVATGGAVSTNVDPDAGVVAVAVATAASLAARFEAGKLFPYLRSQPAPAVPPLRGPGGSAVRTLVGSSFRQVVVADTATNVFLLLHAPWCGYCKSLAPVWEELAMGFATDPGSQRDDRTGVVTTAAGTRLLFASMDAEKNEALPQFPVPQYPTIYLAGATDSGKLAPRQYAGPRTAAAMREFLLKHAMPSPERPSGGGGDL